MRVLGSLELGSLEMAAVMCELGTVSGSCAISPETAAISLL